MKKGRKEVLLLIILVIAFFAINYAFIDTGLETFLTDIEYANATRIIDGDTFEISSGESIRLLGINTPERGEKYYDEAKEFLSEMILDETVKLEFTSERYDKYDRLLAYVFLENENINIKMVESGFANYYFYSGEDKYSDDLEQAWRKCINSNKNLCESSTNACAKCIKITGSTELTNICDFSCDITNWIIKGEGREKFIFNETIMPNEFLEFELDLTNSRGSLFLRDKEGKLVVWVILKIYK